MKKRVYASLLAGCLVASGYSMQTASCLPANGPEDGSGMEIRFTAANYDGFKPTVDVEGRKYNVEMDSLQSKGVVKIELQSPAFAEVTVGKGIKFLAYIVPEKQLDITYDCNDRQRKASFSGELQTENDFLARKGFYSRFPMNKPRDPFAENLHKIDSVLGVNKALLKDESRLSPEFKDLENRRIDLMGLQALNRMIVLRDTAAYSSTVLQRIPTDEQSLKIPGYANEMESALKHLTMFEVRGEIDGTEALKVDFVESHLSDSKVKSAMLERFIMPLLITKGIAGNEKYVELFRKHVTDPERLKELDKIYQSYSKVAAGKPCPDFRMKDVNGKEVALADLAGKYVFIDMWATWCGPCKGEMPSLKVLEEKFAGKDLTFVSISLDRNRDIAKWKKTVADMKLGGIQLHLGEDWDWLKNFMPKGIVVPRFVLLDKEGKIINSNMTRPSDPATERTLEALFK